MYVFIYGRRQGSQAINSKYKFGNTKAYINERTIRGKLSEGRFSFSDWVGGSSASESFDLFHRSNSYEIQKQPLQLIVYRTLEIYSDVVSYD